MLNLSPKFSVAIAIVTLGSAAIATSQAQASIVTYDFTVNVTQGSLAGQSYSGTLSYDDSTLKGTGVEKLGVAQGLRVCMNYFGRNYSETSDRDYPKFPTLVFKNGDINHLDFWIQPQKRVVWWNLPGWEVNLSKRQAGADVPNCAKSNP
ncbi:hypothetical protein NDI44_07900 [Trichocoleus sp. DQ-A3]|uniref:hypothetical protein n=1 Tax=Cyanophyceae TaxID=3028117 RepID=UPI0016896AC4|nr:hypothetical protein [Coleofasciculus sp. FACHB-125]MBD1899114.1 hypothetical protein [Coleofasciculus sp. FACHB-125]